MKKIHQRAESTLLYETLEFIEYAIAQSDNIDA